MENESEVANRKDALYRELRNRCDAELLWARANHVMSLVFMGLALGCSIAAAVMGFFFPQIGSKAVGGIALLPALIAYVAGTLKFEGKNSWHARLYDGLNTLRSRLLYQLPDPPSIDQIARIASERDQLEIQMQAEWDRALLLSWTGVVRQNPPGHQHSGPPADGPSVR